MFFKTKTNKKIKLDVDVTCEKKSFWGVFPPCGYINRFGLKNAVYWNVSNITISRNLKFRFYLWIFIDLTLPKCPIPLSETIFLSVTFLWQNHFETWYQWWWTNNDYYKHDNSNGINEKNRNCNNPIVWSYCSCIAQEGRENAKTG